MKSYHAKRLATSSQVTVHDGISASSLSPRLDLHRHSHQGFEWGYNGSGPTQLSLAILADFLGDDQEAMRLRHDFRQKVIAPLTGDEWTLTAAEIQMALDEIRNAYQSDHAITMPGLAESDIPGAF